MTTMSSRPIRVHQSPANLVGNALRELDGLILMVECMRDQATTMHADLNLLLELRQRFIQLIRQFDQLAHGCHRSARSL